MNSNPQAEPKCALPGREKPDDKVLAMLAHDIRNPLAAVVNGVQVLRQAGIDGPLAEQTLDLIERQLKRVIQLMDNLMQPDPTANGASSQIAEEEQPSNGVHTGPLRLLVVEDNRDVAKSLTSLLRLWGHDVNVAYDGLQALTAADKNHPEIVLLDLDLPGLDGLAVARRLRETPALKQTRLDCHHRLGR